MSRVRLSLLEVQAKYDSGEDRSLLENLIRAFRGIKELDPFNFNSFFEIAGYHGEPFRGKGETDPKWWGGYCNHANVLFPTWHRAYLLRLEDALRSIPNCQDVTLPFFDELAAISAGSREIVPKILTAREFPLDGRKDNPLYSYKLQRELVERVKGAKSRYSKHVNYETVRYPLAGLVGMEKDKVETAVHNAKYPDPDINVKILNDNLYAWLTGTVDIDPDPETPQPDTYSVFARFKTCLDAPNYTIFSNTKSQNEAIKKAGGTPGKDHWFVALESPHNAMHLAIGGFWQKGKDGYNADPIRGANGDMGDNETASFDPIFFFHHAFIDLVFWKYQQKQSMTRKLEIDESDPGATREEGMPDSDPETQLTMDSPLQPFKKADGGYYTPNDVTDIVNQLDYDYGASSIDFLLSAPNTFGSIVPGNDGAAPIIGLVKALDIDRTQYEGSFVVRTYASSPKYPHGVEIGREAILSRWNLAGCANCQSNLRVDALTPVDTVLLDTLKGGDKDTEVKYYYKVQTHDVRVADGWQSFSEEVPIEGDFWE